MGIKIENLSGFLANIDKKEQEIQEFFASIMRGVAYTIGDEAIANVRVDNGDLSQSIFVEPGEDKYTYNIGTNLKYGAYVEFGTGRLVEVPEELKEMALKFKADPRIREVNLPARPWLYPALQYGRQYLVKQIEANWKDLK